MNIAAEVLLFVSISCVVGYFLFRTQSGLQVRRRFAAGAQESADSETPVAETEPNEDYAFLLERCGGSETEVLRRLEVETRKNPNLSEAALYRRAIRAWFVEKRGGTHGSIAEELDDTWL
ncbi:MAG: hypothetical protein VX246_01015 [Myxococcota bacterium]|nr:hypothetical protein [Myxococcota bacterium]